MGKSFLRSTVLSASPVASTYRLHHLQATDPKPTVLPEVLGGGLQLPDFLVEVSVFDPAGSGCDVFLFSTPLTLLLARTLL